MNGSNRPPADASRASKVTEPMHHSEFLSSAPLHCDVLIKDGRSVAGCMGFGLLLAWMWLGLIDGIPFYENGFDGSIPIVLLLGTFALVCGLIVFLSYHSGTLSLKVLVAAGTIFAVCGSALAVIECAVLASSLLIVAALLLIGVGAACLLQPFGFVFARLDLGSLFIACAISAVFVFIGYFGVVAHSELARYLIFCMLPLVSGLLVLPSVPASETTEKPGQEFKRPLPKGFIGFIIASCLYSFAMSFMKAMEPDADFAIASQEAVFFVMVIMLVAAFLATRKLKPVLVLQVLYIVATCILVAGVVLGRVIKDGYVGTAIVNSTCLLLILFFWLITALVCQSHKLDAGRIFAVITCAIGVSLLLGWAFGVLIHATYSPSREVFNTVVACTVALGCAFCFTARSISSFAATETEDGSVSWRPEEERPTASAATQTPTEDADEIGDLATRYQLTSREAEVLALLAQGLRADTISRNLFISYNTVRVHIANIYSKLDVHSQDELILKLRGKEL